MSSDLKKPKHPPAVKPEPTDDEIPSWVTKIEQARTAVIQHELDRKAGGRAPLPGPEPGPVALRLPGLDAPSVDASATAVVAKQAVATELKKKEPEQGWFCFAAMPTDMCRVSPFHPMSKQDLAEREFLRGKIITKSSWGELKYTGPKLSTYEEDALLAILACTDPKKPPHFIYEGPTRPILQAMGYKNPSQKNYKMFSEQLTLLMSAVFEMNVRGQFRKLDNILSTTMESKDSKYIRLVINPYFYEMYLAGNVRLIDIEKRKQLNKPTSKSLFRFVESHKGPFWRGHFMTLAASLNLDASKPAFRLRAQVKEAIAEMIAKGQLNKESGFDADSRDVVELHRTA